MNQFFARRNIGFTGISIPSLQFNRNKHPHASLKAFNDLIEHFELQYAIPRPV